MIDSVKFYLKQDDLKYTDILAEIPNFLTNPQEQNFKGDVVIKGNIGNMLVTAKEHGLTITGSLPKFLNGHNIGTSDYKGVLMSLEKLSDELHIRPDDLSKARVNRMDLAATIKTNHLETDYFNHLGYKPRYYRYEEGSTVYYNSAAKNRANKRTQDVFYSKSEEVKKENNPSLKDYNKSNLLRCETRILRPFKYFRGTITVNQLTDKEFHKQCVNKWNQEYNSINKISYTMPDFSMVKNPKNLHDYILAHYVSLVGIDAVLKIPDNFKRHNVFQERKYYTRSKDMLLDRLKYISEYAEHDLIKELNQKIADAAAEQIEGLNY